MADTLLILVVVLVGGFVAWKLFLGAVKGVSKAVSAGVAEGRGSVAPAPPTRPSEEDNSKLGDELVMATYHLGESELKRDPKAYGYDGDDWRPSEADISSGSMSFQALGQAIKKMSPINPARLALEELVEVHAVKALGGAEADKLAIAHKEARILEVLQVGAKVRAGRS
jgi:hypothetical protein